MMTAINSTEFAIGPPASQLVRLTTQWLGTDTALITAAGEIDAANADEFREHITDALVRGKHLALDLSQLKFFGTEGFSALHRISVRCAEADVRWAMVPGAEVRRVLRICDPEGNLPAVDAVDEAMAVVRGSRPLLAVVSH